MNPLTFEATRKVEVTGEDVPRIKRISLTRIVRLALSAVDRTRIQAVPHTSSPSRGPELGRQIFMHTLGANELTIHVCQLAPRVPQEDPAGQGVERGAEIQKHDQRGGHDERAVEPKQCGLIWRKKTQLARQP